MSLTLGVHVQRGLLVLCLSVINPRRACTAMVTVLGLSVCPSVTMFSATTHNKQVKKRHQRVQCYTGFIFKMAYFHKSAAFRSCGVKTK